MPAKAYRMQIRRCVCREFAANSLIPSPRRPSARSWIELRAKRKRLFQVFDEDANLRRHPAAGGSHGKDRHSSFKGTQKTQNRTLSEFCGEQPCRRLSNPQIFEHAAASVFLYRMNSM
jgi:hypothetical protein